MSKKKVGRPSVMTPEILERLRSAFAIGATDEEACVFAGIGTTTLYVYQENHPEFKEEKEQLKMNPVLQARNNIVEAMKKKNNETEAQRQIRLETSKWYLQRKKKDEFGNSLIDVKNDNRSIQIIKEDPKAIDTLIKSYEAIMGNIKNLPDNEEH